eukprot:PhM_4_TR359/c0_g1_i3/m.71426
MLKQKKKTEHEPTSTEAVVLLHLRRLDLAVELELNANVEITVVTGIGRARQRALDLLTFQNLDGLRQVEHSLLPVRGGAVRRRREHNVLVVRKGRVEPRNERVNRLVAGSLHREWCHKRKIGDGHFREVEVNERSGVGTDLLGLDDFDQGLDKGGTAHCGEVESVDVIPVSYLSVPVVGVLDAGDEHLGFVGEKLYIRGTELVAGHQHGVQHGLVDEEVAHPLRDDDIDLLGHIDLLELSVENRDDIVKLVLLDDLPGLVSNGAALNSVNLAGASAGGKHREDTCATANIKDDFVLEQMGVAIHGVPVRARADLIFQHGLVDAVVTITVEVVVGIGAEFLLCVWRVRDGHSLVVCETQ